MISTEQLAHKAYYHILMPSEDQTADYLDKQENEKDQKKVAERIEHYRDLELRRDAVYRFPGGALVPRADEYDRYVSVTRPSDRERRDFICKQMGEVWQEKVAPEETIEKRKKTVAARWAKVWGTTEKPPPKEKPKLTAAERDAQRKAAKTDAELADVYSQQFYDLGLEITALEKRQG